MGGESSPRPHELPPGSLFLFAEEESTITPAPVRLIGSLCLMPLYAGTASFDGLPHGIVKAGEIKRTIVLPEHRGKGVASKLIAAAEDIAKTGLGIQYVVVETLLILKGAQSLYKATGFKEQDLFGGYVQEDSRCFDKWL